MLTLVIPKIVFSPTHVIQCHGVYINSYRHVHPVIHANTSTITLLYCLKFLGVQIPQL